MHKDLNLLIHASYQGFLNHIPPQPRVWSHSGWPSLSCPEPHLTNKHDPPSGGNPGQWHSPNLVGWSHAQHCLLTPSGCQLGWQILSRLFHLKNDKNKNVDSLYFMGVLLCEHFIASWRYKFVCSLFASLHIEYNSYYHNKFMGV